LFVEEGESAARRVIVAGSSGIWPKEEEEEF
jgi:hypothetical protein